MSTATMAHLLEQHRALIAGSAIAPEVATARGYESVTDPHRLLGLGFSEAQARVPGLLNPLWNADGEVAGYQYRPDVPRERDGKAIKYESPPRQRNVLDVNPLMKDKLSGAQVVFVTEGARKADAIATMGLPCINLAGVYGWRGRNEDGGYTALADWETVNVKGSIFVLAFDSDILTKREVHQALSRLRSFLLSKRAEEVRVLVLPPILSGKTGVDDYIAATGAGVQDLAALVQGELPEPPSTHTTPLEAPWPSPLAPEAYHGLAGEVVRAIRPHTEAHDAGLFANFLVGFGSSVGRGPHAVAEADRHGCNLSAALVGDTAKGRKGTSWGHTRKLFDQADPTWTGEHVKHGLSSGEGLTWHVRDPIERTVPIREKGRVTGQYETVVEDVGIADKRLLIIESEFASPLRIMDREGNTLSPTLRQAWDDGNLQILTKNSPARATGAHISVIGHITKGELLRYLNSTETGNGFANRFLWICTRRARVLPEGGGDVNYGPLVERLHKALERGREMDLLQRDDAARRLWAEVYPELSEGRPGLLGAVTARAEAQVLRLSLLYAVIDGASAIAPEHLKAALAVWEYAEASARHIFGEATGDSVADRTLRALRDACDGLTRTGISGLFGRNVPAPRIDAGLQTLEAAGLARCEVRQGDKGGRPIEKWYATGT